MRCTASQPTCMPACLLAVHCPLACLLLPTLHCSRAPLRSCSAPPAAKVVSAEVRRKIEERERALAAAEAAAGPLTATQIARLQFQASQLLLPGESVAAGLKRLGGHSRRPAKRSKQQQRGASEGGDADVAAAEVAPDPAAKEQFNQLTEAAMKLMDAGENDVYTQKKVGGQWGGLLTEGMCGLRVMGRGRVVLGWHVGLLADAVEAADCQPALLAFVCLCRSISSVRRLFTSTCRGPQAAWPTPDPRRQPMRRQVGSFEGMGGSGWDAARCNALPSRLRLLCCANPQLTNPPAHFLWAPAAC